MKYKVGDKIKVHTKEWLRTNCNKDCLDAFIHEDGNNSFVKGMEKFCGQEVTIKQVFLDCYNILEDDGHWYWENWMFEDMNNNTNNNTNIIYNPNIVEDFAKLIGVELDEEFYDNDEGWHYKFTADSGLMVYDNIKEYWYVASVYSLTTFFKMIKEGKFTKKWTPKTGDMVYFPDFMTNNLWNYKVYGSENEHDKEMLKSGLYFKTSEEAVECAKKIIKNMKEK